MKNTAIKKSTTTSEKSRTRMRTRQSSSSSTRRSSRGSRSLVISFRILWCSILRWVCCQMRMSPGGSRTICSCRGKYLSLSPPSDLRVVSITSAKAPTTLPIDTWTGRIEMIVILAKNVKNSGRVHWFFEIFKSDFLGFRRGLLGIGKRFLRDACWSTEGTGSVKLMQSTGLTLRLLSEIKGLWRRSKNY